MDIENRPLLMCTKELCIFFILPFLVLIYLIFNNEYKLIELLLNSVTQFFLILPTWLVPIVGPGSLFVILIGVPLVLGRLFGPNIGKVAFGSVSLTFTILLIRFMAFLSLHI